MSVESTIRPYFLLIELFHLVAEMVAKGKEQIVRGGKKESSGQLIVKQSSFFKCFLGLLSPKFHHFLEI